MKKTIRKGVFETNSSSTHSICIAKTNNIVEVPEKITIDFKDGYEFGWEEDKREYLHDKLAYLILGILTWNNENSNKQYKKLGEMLYKLGINSLHVEGIELVTYEGRTYIEPSDNCSYVDHSSELNDFVEAVLSDEYLLKQYLFNNDSFILTGNDNNDSDISINVNYEYEEFYKGN